MNPRTEANINQLANDIHLITWPFRFIWAFIKTCAFVAAFILGVPLIFVGLLLHYVLTGQTILNDVDSVLPLKIIFCFCQPFILPIVYRFAQMGTKMRNRAQVKATFCVSMHWVFVAVLGLELLGALVNYSWWDGMATEGSLAVLVIYLSSPLVFLIFTKDQPPLAPVAPDRSAYQSAAPRRSNPLWN
jgi:hypothetical protein